MNSNARWQNPYISLCKAGHDGLISCSGKEFSEEELRQIAARLPQAARLYCEIGSGSGAHLAAQAARDPEGFYTGFELRFKRAYRCAQKAAKIGLRNVLVLRANAAQLGRIFEPGALSGIYINFPDPWSKRRWHKHRTFSAEFLNRAAELLKSGGFISYKTDHREYFEAALELAGKHADFSAAKCSRDLYQSEFAELNPASEFECLFRNQGLPIYFAEFVRV